MNLDGSLKEHLCHHLHSPVVVVVVVKGCMETVRVRWNVKSGEWML